VLQEFQRQVSGRVVLGDMFIGLQVFLNVCDAVLDLVPVVDVQVARELAGALIDLDDGAEQVFHALSALKRCGNHWHTKQGAQCVEVNLVATVLELVVHIECAHHT